MKKKADRFRGVRQSCVIIVWSFVIIELLHLFGVRLPWMFFSFGAPTIAIGGTGLYFLMNRSSGPKKDENPMRPTYSGLPTTMTAETELERIVREAQAAARSMPDVAAPPVIAAARAPPAEPVNVASSGEKTALDTVPVSTKRPRVTVMFRRTMIVTGDIPLENEQVQDEKIEIISIQDPAQKPPDTEKQVVSP